MATPITHRDLMIATPAREPFSRPGWLFELKYDGFRLLVRKERGEVRLITRGGIDLAKAFPELVLEAEALPDVVLDSELVMLDEKGVPQFDKLLRRAAMRRRPPIRYGPNETIAIYAFDLLWLKGEDWRARPLLERKGKLRELLRRSGRIRCLEHIRTDGAALYAAVAAAGLEGVVGKKENAPYRAGKSSAWLKIKTPAHKAIEAKRLAHRKR